jgi:hypothetical protein
MPNWCANKLEIYGDKKDIIEIHKKLIEDGVLDMYGLTGEPDTKDWYDWNVENLGTKWEKCDITFDHSDSDGLCVEFDTAWSPPIPFIEKLAKAYPNVNIALKYDEPGMGFMGVATACGNKLDDQMIEY